MTIPPPKSRINSNCPSPSEIKSAIKALKSGKAPGPDGIFVELLQADVDIVSRQIHPIIESFWELGEFPEEMKESLLVKLPKKGDLSQLKNWRGIALLNSINKLVARIILDRIAPSVESRLRKEQAGFRRGRSCIDQINTLRIIVEQSREFNSSLCLLFIDFERAFDSLNQAVMWKILAKYGIPEKVIEVIQDLYQDASLKVVHRGTIGTGFQVTSGVKQGCILSPLLFNIALDYVLRVVSSKPRGIHWNTFTRLLDLDYADDIVALTHNLKEMREFLSDLVRYAADVGLKINVSKTNLMRINPPRSTRATSQVPQTIEINGTRVEEVQNFIYLGSVISTQGGAEEDVRRRIQLANVAFGSLNHVWRSKRLSLRLKLRFFNSNVKSVLMYGCETWKVTKSLIHRVQVFVNKCLRKICGIFYPDIISNEDLMTKTNQRPIADEIGTRKWGWIGHTLRKKPDDLCRQALSWCPPGARSVGRPKVTWQSSVRKEAEQQGKQFSELAELAKNRVRFNRFVSALHFTSE